MAVFRVKKEKNYTTISNYHMREKSLSLKGKGLMTLMLTLPDNWDYSLKGLATLSKDGIDSVTAGIKELEKAGYVTRNRIRNEKGHMTDVEYIITEYPVKRADEHNKKNTNMDNFVLDQPNVEKPISANPELDFPILDNPNLENPRQLNTNKQNTKELNTNQSNHIQSVETYTEDSTQKIDGFDVYNGYKQIVEKNIEYSLYESEGANLDKVTEIRDIIIEVLCTRKDYTNIAGDDYPTELVRNKYLKINYHHIEYVLACLNDNSTQVRNMKKYLMTALFNAPSTMSNYYSSLVNYHQNN